MTVIEAAPDERESRAARGTGNLREPKRKKANTLHRVKRYRRVARREEERAEPIAVTLATSSRRGFDARPIRILSRDTRSRRNGRAAIIALECLLTAVHAPLGTRINLRPGAAEISETARVTSNDCPHIIYVIDKSS